MATRGECWLVVCVLWSPFGAMCPSYNVIRKREKASDFLQGDARCGRCVGVDFWRDPLYNGDLVGGCGGWLWICVGL